MYFFVILAILALIIAGIVGAIVLDVINNPLSIANYKKKYKMARYNATDIGDLYLTKDSQNKVLCYLVINDDVDLKVFHEDDIVLLRVKKDTQE